MHGKYVHAPLICTVLNLFQAGLNWILAIYFCIILSALAHYFALYTYMKSLCTCAQLTLCPFLLLQVTAWTVQLVCTCPSYGDLWNHYHVGPAHLQWCCTRSPPSTSARAPVFTSDPIAITASNNTYNIASLSPNTKYVISLLVVDVCGGMTAASLTARTNGECTGKRLFWICIGNFLCDFMLVMPPDPVWTCTYAWSSTKCSVRSVFGHDQS